MSKPKVAFFISHYKRPEYVAMTLKSLEESQEYENVHFYIVEDDNPNLGLRQRIINFFDEVRGQGYDYLIKMDGDCLVPNNYINDMVAKMQSTDADMLSPNVMPSNAAMNFGKDDLDNKGYRPSDIIGGLWCMKASLIEDMYFESHPTNGLTGAISLLKQICVEKEPKIGWVTEIVVEDVGHWSGRHEKHIKTKDHEMYSKEVGRQVAWSAK